MVQGKCASAAPRSRVPKGLPERCRTAPGEPPAGLRFRLKRTFFFNSLSDSIRAALETRRALPGDPASAPGCGATPR